jgi:hypothetical protein
MIPAGTTQPNAPGLIGIIVTFGACGDTSIESHVNNSAAAGKNITIEEHKPLNVSFTGPPSHRRLFCPVSKP